ncbi:hypothetical protein SEA_SCIENCEWIZSAM_40 [Arthrobacter phage ScienceWizSam]|uniref:Uncharacterized protein n=1 Tax=Arthrobacter phage ScienceWizSam TaxID=2927283 RepID=A0A9E7P603_9CAUD|nr:hypothetical protein QCN41_gp40 [Arthrobacter phage ScienceWizSam]UUG69284.1 hypothetical protein SEA_SCIENCEWIZSAM_40 [Arthrobacter phage ScienceWizSam]
MFKNRSVQVKLVKDTEDSITNETRHNLIVNEDTAAIAKDIIKHVGVAIVAVSGSIITFKTLSQMAVIKTQAKAYKPMHKL